jgi:Domain of unknown function (DUF5615)
MTIKYLMDENVIPTYAKQIRRRRPDLVIWTVGDIGAPGLGTLDPEILIWCEEYDFILVTNNRKSMPGHLRDHIAFDRHIPGIFLLNLNMSIGQNIDELLLIADGSLDGEYQDQIIHLPLT